ASAGFGPSAPEFPIVLAEGVGGVPFFGVAAALRLAGANVCETHVSPYNSSLVRAQQLIPQIQACAAQYGKAKVNLIGHSQGGLDARVVLALVPGLLASVTTVGSPHRGSTSLADAGANIVPPSVIPGMPPNPRKAEADAEAAAFAPFLDPVGPGDDVNGLA